MFEGEIAKYPILSFWQAWERKDWTVLAADCPYKSASVVYIGMKLGRERQPSLAILHVYSFWGTLPHTADAIEACMFGAQSLPHQGN